MRFQSVPCGAASPESDMTFAPEIMYTLRIIIIEYFSLLESRFFSRLDEKKMNVDVDTDVDIRCPLDAPCPIGRFYA